MKEEVLSKRLLAAAELVPKGAVTADVGADHAALSLYLLQKGIAPRVVVSDINPLPLQRGKETFKDSGLCHRADFVLADGIRPLLKYSPDCFVVAGMGGETVSGMLCEPDGSLLGKSFVFQPMTKAPHLRKFLWENGFEITRDILVWEHKRLFVVMKAAYSGVKRTLPELEYFAGREVLSRREPLWRECLVFLSSRLEKEIRGMEISGGVASKKRALYGEIKDILEGKDYEPKEII
ncbi:MAG: SAM-dependent methyltransferase [Ruminococcaceae bacterium]|nr:SAM-dependent methyltransferase [Oscillospiraceae bacterium]